jgi:hypothetical protein
MNNTRQKILCAALIIFAGLSINVMAQRSINNERQALALLTTIQNNTNTFRTQLNNVLDRRTINSTQSSTEIIQYVQDFQNANNQLRRRLENSRDTSIVSTQVQEVLNRASYIDAFMRANNFNNRIETSWTKVRSDLDRLARYYNVSWNWDNQNYPSNTYPTNTNGTLTGTYRLDYSRSDNIATVVESETRTLRNNRLQVSNELRNRLATPDNIAIDQRGRTITIVSTLAPQMTLEADGRAHTERTSQGRNVSVTATLNRDQLTIGYTGDRGNVFNATIVPIDNGQRLQVTRNVYVEELGRNIRVNTFYDRTASVAQLDLYRNTPNNTAIGAFYVPNNTVITARLNQDLDSGMTKEGDRFSATITAPSQYAGAVVEGYVSKVERSGRLTGRAEMTLMFDRIRLRNGNEYQFAGLVESVRTPNGETVRVDNEGVVQEDSQTNRTITRTGIGAAIGAVIGAIAGGGKGAAIGAAVGAGAGTGTVLIQGRDNIDLDRGTEFVIRSSAPRSLEAGR